MVVIDEGVCCQRKRVGEAIDATQACGRRAVIDACFDDDMSCPLGANDDSIAAIGGIGAEPYRVVSDQVACVHVCRFNRTSCLRRNLDPIELISVGPVLYDQVIFYDAIRAGCNREPGIASIDNGVAGKPCVAVIQRGGLVCHIVKCDSPTATCRSGRINLYSVICNEQTVDRQMRDNWGAQAGGSVLTANIVPDDLYVCHGHSPAQVDCMVKYGGTAASVPIVIGDVGVDPCPQKAERPVVGESVAGELDVGCRHDAGVAPRVVQPHVEVIHVEIAQGHIVRAVVEEEPAVGISQCAVITYQS